MKTTLNLTNSELRNYFDIVGNVNQKNLNYFTENTNITDTEKQLRIYTLLNNKNKDKPDVVFKVLDADKTGDEKIDTWVNSNELKKYLTSFDKEEKLTITPKEDKLEINAENVTLELKANNKDYNVSDLLIDYDMQVEIDPLEFLNGLENVLNAIENESGNSHMKTVKCLSLKVDKENNRVELAGIDGFRLNTKQLNHVYIHSNNKENKQYLITKQAVAYMIKMIKKIKSLGRKENLGMITLSFNDEAMVCNVYSSNLGCYDFLTYFEQGDFFNYDAIIPKESKTEFNTNKEELLKEVKKLLNVPKTDDRHLMIMELNSDKVELSTNNEIAKMKIDYSNKVKDYEGENLRIGFNTKYIIEALDKLDRNQEVKIAFQNDVGPVQFKYTDKNGNDGLNLVLPVRLG